MKQYDYSGLSHHKPHIRQSIRRPIGDALIVLGGGEAAVVREVSPPEEILTFMFLGVVLFLASSMTASTVATLLHFATGDDQIHVGHILVGLLVGTMQGATDSVIQFRTKFHERGAYGASFVGTLLPLFVTSGWETVMLNIVRCSQSFSIGLMAAVCMILVALSPSIRTFETNFDRTKNPVAYEQSAKQVDAVITRTNADITASDGRIRGLDQMIAKLRQSEVNLAVRGQGRRQAAVAPASDLQISQLEAARTAEIAKREELKTALANQSADREKEIERKVSASGNATARLSGLSGQLTALTALVKDDWKLLVVVAALMIASCALELSPMWISLRYYPAVYASHIAVERFLAVHAVADSCVGRLEPGRSMRDAGPLPLTADVTSDTVATGAPPPSGPFDPLAENPERSPPTANHDPVIFDDDQAVASDDASGPTTAHASVADALGLARRRLRRPDNNSSMNGGDHE